MIKLDCGKPRMDLLPPNALLFVGHALAHGAEKYGDTNWQGVGANRYIAACLRHVFKYLAGEKMDADSGLPHLALAATNLLFATELGVYWDLYRLPLDGDKLAEPVETTK